MLEIQQTSASKSTLFGRKIRELAHRGLYCVHLPLAKTARYIFCVWAFVSVFIQLTPMRP